MLRSIDKKERKKLFFKGRKTLQIEQPPRMLLVCEYEHTISVSMVLLPFGAQKSPENPHKH